MKIIISTQNKAKIQAVKEVFEKVYGNINIIGEKFNSDVAEQPLSEEEGIKGAINRAKYSKIKYPNADFYVGMEGYVDTNKYGMFLGGVVAIISKEDKLGIGFSAKIQLPLFIKHKIETGEELGPLIISLMKDLKGEIHQNQGANGILSKGLYTRIDEFKDATKCALVRFKSPEFFEKLI